MLQDIFNYDSKTSFNDLRMNSIIYPYNTPRPFQIISETEHFICTKELKPIFEHCKNVLFKKYDFKDDTIKKFKKHSYYKCEIQDDYFFI